MIIAMQCDYENYNEQLKQQYPQAYEKYLDTITNSAIPKCIRLSNSQIIHISDELQVINMYAETEEQLDKCKVDMIAYAKRTENEIRFSLDNIMAVEEVVATKEIIEPILIENALIIAQCTTCCVTGHRPKDLYGYDRKAYSGLKKAIIESIREMIKLGINIYINGMAQGADQLFFWCVHSLKSEYPNIRNVCYIPFNGQELKWQVDGAFGQDDYNLVLKYADEVINCNPNCNKENNQDVIISLMERNTKMIKQSSIILAITNNSVDNIKTKEYKGKGGTADAIKKALKLKKEIWEINPISLKTIKNIN